MKKHELKKMRKRVEQAGFTCITVRRFDGESECLVCYRHDPEGFRFRFGYEILNVATGERLLAGNPGENDKIVIRDTDLLGWKKLVYGGNGTYWACE